MSTSTATEKPKLAGFRLLGSRIARLIFASNLAGLIILIVGAMVLNEMRTTFVESKKQDLISQANVLSNIFSQQSTYGRPEPAIDETLARESLTALALPESLRGKIYSEDQRLIGDSYYLSDRVIVSDLPPLADPGMMTIWGTQLSEWMQRLLSSVSNSSSENTVASRSFEEEFAAALLGDNAVSQRYNDRGQRVISVSVPIQRVSAVVAVLTIESNDIDAVIRAERAALLPFIAVAILVALITSALLTIAIANPLKRLADAADEIRAGDSNALELPKVTRRHDEIGHLGQSIDAMTRALFERITANESFAADVAHELKNPLTSIRSAVETAEMVKDDPVTLEKLRKVIAKDVQRLDRLITDISNASRLEAEITRIPMEPMDLGRFVEDVVSTYDGLHSERDVTVVFNDDSIDPSLMVRGRDGPLGQVFRNLIDNARSFSPQGGRVSVSYRQGGDRSKPMARILIEDNGPGVPADKLEKIFERFYTDRPAGAAFGNNSGLGLSIVAQIAETHGGRVYAENRSTGGARFVVELPAY